MKTIELKLYQYSELNEKAKEKAREWYLRDLDFDSYWQFLKDDAKNIGLNLKSWDYGRYLTAEFIGSAKECAEKILKEHVKKCETYATAKHFLFLINRIKNEEKAEEREKYFLNKLSEDYRIMTDEQYDFCQSEEAIAEMMECNEWDFTEDGDFFSRKGR